MNSLDAIHHSVTIAAPRHTIWNLLREPGWWISDADGNRETWSINKIAEGIEFAHPEYGTFVVTQGAEVAGERVTFGSLLGPAGSRKDGTETTFTLSGEDGDVTVDVDEIGFARVFPDNDEREAAMAGNIDGWIIELDLLKKWAENGQA